MMGLIEYPMKSNKPLHTFAIFLLTAITIANTAFAQSSSQSIVPTKNQLKEINCQPQIVGKHLQLFYRERSALSKIGQPKIDHTCGSSVEVHSDEQYHMLGCLSEGFTNYFAVDRWSVAKIKGDGGVDVTGAPNSMLVEGANIAQSKVPANGLLQFNIAIPAEGFITFDWRNIGGSNLFVGTQTNTDDPVWEEADNNYFSMPLSAGDQLVIYLPADQQTPAELLHHYISNFKFLTNSMGVVVRHWEATDEAGNEGHFTQFISIEKASLAQLFFPAATQTNKKAEQATPQLTGFPVLDLDGNLGTTGDQYLLEEKDDVFDLTWTDELIQNKDGFFLQRTWAVEDWCSGSTLQKTQLIRLEESLQQLPAHQLDNATGLNLRLPNQKDYSNSTYIDRALSAPNF